MKNIYNSIKQGTRKALKIGLSSLLILSNLNCSKPKGIQFDTKYKDMYISIIMNGDYKTLSLSRYGLENKWGLIQAVDRNRDGKFDHIPVALPEGSDMKKYANLDSLEHIYQTAKSQFEAELNEVREEIKNFRKQ